jgi:hypothetical protein
MVIWIDIYHIISGDNGEIVSNQSYAGDINGDIPVYNGY